MHGWKRQLTSLGALGLIVGVTTLGPRRIIIRPAVPDASYLVPDSAFPPLADLPYEGHGVLIAPRWVVTAAHATGMVAAMPDARYVTLDGTRRGVSKVIVYPGFAASKSAFEPFNQRVGSGRAAAADSLLPKALVVQASMHDIALLELAQPVVDVTPVPLYTRSDERGRVVKLYGKGATGNGSLGEYPDAKRRGRLRRAYNRVTRTDGQWLIYRFDCGGTALRLEGVLGHGDSGGPALIEDDGAWKLAGVAHGLYMEQGFAFEYRGGRFEYGLCGQDFAYSRLSYYASWIDSVMDAEARSGAQARWLPPSARRAAPNGVRSR